jgi:hypothetical protein
MSDEPKKRDGRRLGRWLTLIAVALLPLVYILSFGPIMDALSATPPGSMTRRVGFVVYRPVLYTVAYGPRWVAGPLFSLATLFTSHEPDLDD